MKLFFNIAFLVVIVAGSIGIPVFQHTCVQSNLVAKTFFVSPDNCHEKQDAHLKHSCCEEKQTKVKHDCCSDEVSAYKIGFFKGNGDSYHFIICQSVSNSIPFYENQTAFPAVKNKILGFADLPPPKLTSRLALLQVWRI